MECLQKDPRITTNKPIYIDQNNKKYKFVLEWCGVEKNFLPRMWILEYLQFCSILDATLMSPFKKENIFMTFLWKCFYFLWYKRSWNYGLGTPAQETQMMYFVSILLCIKRDSTELLTCREVTAQRAGVGLERSKQRIFVSGGIKTCKNLKMWNVYDFYAFMFFKVLWCPWNFRMCLISLWSRGKFKLIPAISGYFPKHVFPPTLGQR